MQFTPKSKKELDESALIPAGDQDVECYEAEEATSKKGNAMMVLKLKVYVGDGHRFHTDYIVTGNDMGLAKLYSFCFATGLLDKYEAGELTAEDCIGKSCKAIITQREDRETKEPRNDLRKYITLEEANEREKARAEKAKKKGGLFPDGVPASAQPDPNDDVPF